MEQMLEILKILQKYTNQKYLFFAEHDVIGFLVDYQLISETDMKQLTELGVFYDYAYNSLVIYV